MEKFSIVLPPPNVTGSLHMGHAFNTTIQDILIKYKRLKGFDVKWQAGLDHAGIATQMVVEKKLLEKGILRKNITREEFLDHVWKWKEESGGIILDQLKQLSHSIDFDNVKFTMDERVSELVVAIFVKLYEEGLIYKDKKLVNFDPVLETAVSDLEVVTKEEKTDLYYISYVFEEDQSQNIIIATTRPETIFADVALAVHPNDDRYKDLVGKKVLIPIIKKAIPIIADEYPNPEKGSGVVKITPGHDFNDFEVGKRHGLDVINILDFNGNLNSNVPNEYQGLSVLDARKKILTELEVIKVEKILSPMPYGDRSNALIQPLVTEQWFLNVSDMAKEAIKAVEDGLVKFYPKSWENTFFHFLKNIEPWCISRQLWWGHRIPAWYAEDDKVFVAKTEAEANEKAFAHFGKKVSLKQDNDVLDTWFSSQLWPFASLDFDAGHLENTQSYKGKYFPTDVLVTGFDIIFFWVARMLMISLHLFKKPPFKHVYVHSLIRDSKGQKMSKSKGNVVDPLSLVEEYGVDAVRFSLASFPAKDIKLSNDKIETSRNFITKIRNAAKFLKMNDLFEEKTTKEHVLTNWIRFKLNELIQLVEENISDYRFDLCVNAIYKFFWNDFCDVYLEGVKSIEDKNIGAYEIFIEFLTVLYPFCPVISSEFIVSKSFSNLSWPNLKNIEFDEKTFDAIKLTEEIRSLKGLLGVKEKIDIGCNEFDDFIVKNWNWFSKLSGASQYVLKDSKVLVRSNVFLICEANIDVLNKKKKSFEVEIERLSNKLLNMVYKEAKPDDYTSDEALFMLKEKELQNLNAIIAKII